MASLGVLGIVIAQAVLAFGAAALPGPHAHPITTLCDFLLFFHFSSALGTLSALLSYEYLLGTLGTSVFSMMVTKEFDLITPGAAVAVAWSLDGSALAAASNYGSDLTV
jgi:hypothetical protein